MHFFYGTSPNLILRVCIRKIASLIPGSILIILCVNLVYKLILKLKNNACLRDSKRHVIKRRSDLFPRLITCKTHVKPAYNNKKFHRHTSTLKHVGQNGSARHPIEPRFKNVFREVTFFFYPNPPHIQFRNCCVNFFLTLKVLGDLDTKDSAEEGILVSIRRRSQGS